MGGEGEKESADRPRGEAVGEGQDSSCRGKLGTGGEVEGALGRDFVGVGEKGQAGARFGPDEERGPLAPWRPKPDRSGAPSASGRETEHVGFGLSSIVPTAEAMSYVSLGTASASLVANGDS